MCLTGPTNNNPAASLQGSLIQGSSRLDSNSDSVDLNARSISASSSNGIRNGSGRLASAMSSSINLGAQETSSAHASHSRSFDGDDFLDALSEADDQSEHLSFDEGNLLSSSGSRSRSGETSSNIVEASRDVNRSSSSSSEILIVDPDEKESEISSTIYRASTYSSVESSDSQSSVEYILDIATSEEDQGPGGCCNCPIDVGQSLKAGLVQMVSTAFTFGLKPLVEEGAKAILAPAVGEAIAGPIASVVGGVFIGVIHTTVSTTVSSVMNSLLSATTYTPMDNQFRDELVTLDAPVTGAFVAAYALRGGLVDAQADPWVDAASKTVASLLGGLVQGVVTDVLRQAVFTEDFDQEQPAQFSDIKIKEIAEKAIKKITENGENAGHDYFGKVVGAVVGNMIAPLVAGPDTSGWARGALGMTTFLASWYGGVHGGAFVGDQIASLVRYFDAANDQPNANDVSSETV